MKMDVRLQRYWLWMDDGGVDVELDEGECKNTNEMHM